MPSLKVIKAQNERYSPNYIPVAIFVGGTAGIGQAMAQALAKYTRGNAHIIIIGRNKEAADSTILSFPKPTSPEAKYEFVQADVTLMSNVHAVTAQLLSRVSKINYLVLTTGVANMEGRNETAEGIDRKLALHYYARFACTYDLLPLLKKAEELGEDAKAYSVLEAGLGGEINLDDLGLKKDFTWKKAAVEGRSYMDIAYKEFAEQNPSSTLTFTHANPGAAKTGILKSSETAYVRVLSGAFMTVLSPFILSAKDAGEYQLYGLLQHTGGLQRVGASGQSIGMAGFHGESAEVRRKLWEHTLNECKIDSGLYT